MGRAPGRPKTPAQKARTRRNVGLNKVRKLEKILAKTKNQKQREILLKRIEYWKENRGNKIHRRKKINYD